MNAICERLIGTPRHEVLDRTLILNQAHLRAVLAEYQEHYNTARPHQGIGQRVPHDGLGPLRHRSRSRNVRSAENQSWAAGVGWAVRFLASAEAGCITGQTLIIDGGQVLPEGVG